MRKATTRPIEFVSVREAGETYGYSESHIRSLLAKGLISGAKFTTVWLVNPTSVQEYKAQMAQLGARKHGTWVQHSGRHE